MRFLLYNIRYGTGSGVNFHFPLPYAGFFKRSTVNINRIVEFIRSISPDVVGLIEVDFGSYRTENMCQAELIAKHLGHHCVVETKYGAGSMAQSMPILNKQGNGVLTNQEIISHEYHYLAEGMKRLVIEVRLQDVTVFLVHLSLTYRKRQYQLEQLHRIVSRAKGPVILAGDFNVLWGKRELELFLAATGLQSADEKGLPSHPSHSPKRQLDFILHSREFKVDNFYLPAVTYSDHVPLVCDLSLC